MTTLYEIQNAKILIVDDQEANVKLLEHILSSSGYTTVTSTMDSRQVFDLYRQYRYDLIILDLNMPYLDGFGVMESLKSIEKEGYLPVLVITAEPEKKLRALEIGARDFVSKPFDHIEVLTRIRNMLEVRLLHKKLHSYNDILEQLVQQRTADLRNSYREAIFTLTNAAEHKDEDTGLHIQRIGFYCQELAELLGMGSKFCDEIYYASPMHDIGKMAIPDHILLKPCGLTPEEWDIMKTHTSLGAEILADKKSPYLQMGAEIALNHHECWNGSGYPNKLKGEAIPLPARIMTICDVYDALRSRRPYKPAFDHERAMNIIIKGDGRTQPDHFDPLILNIFTQHQESFREIYQNNIDHH
ncbi:MAG TPA: HD domain-containing phosphohydrolase [Burkholderiaceae bacterium]|jgi:putative two-component system response regulator